MSIWSEFKEFAVKGNAVDLAVGVVIGAAFGKITSSLVADIITPPLGLIIGGIDFSHFAVVLKEATATQPAVTLNYGRFLQNVIDFTIVAFAIFLLVKGVNKLKRHYPQQAQPAPPAEVALLTEIRDLLKKK